MPRARRKFGASTKSARRRRTQAASCAGSFAVIEWTLKRSSSGSAELEPDLAQEFPEWPVLARGDVHGAGNSAVGQHGQRAGDIRDVEEVPPLGTGGHLNGFALNEPRDGVADQTARLLAGAVERDGAPPGEGYAIERSVLRSASECRRITRRVLVHRCGDSFGRAIMPQTAAGAEDVGASACHEGAVQRKRGPHPLKILPSGPEAPGRDGPGEMRQMGRAVRVEQRARGRHIDQIHNLACGPGQRGVAAPASNPRAGSGAIAYW
jgi:hypothetical protein